MMNPNRYVKVCSWCAFRHDTRLPCSAQTTMNDADDDCPICFPLGCDNPDGHQPNLVPSRYTPLRNRGCHCGADFDGRDCMCFED